MSVGEASELFRLAGFGQLVLLAILLLRQRRRGAAIPLAAACCLGVAAYLLCSSPAVAGYSAVLRWPLLFVCLANPWLFWMLANAVFRDNFAPRPAHLLGLALVVLSGLAGILRRDMVGGLAQWVTLIVLAWALWVVYRGRRTDLVESRRRARNWAIAATGIAMLVVTIAELLLAGQPPPALLGLLQMGAIAALVTAVALWIGRVDIDLIQLPVAAASPPIGDTAQRLLLERLQQAIAAGVLLRENLDIAALALELGTQEHRLRRLINGALGHRNFNQFLNQHRIAAACGALADAARLHTPILTIALSLGYGSIGPFNRAFKEITGMTPSEYRRRQLGGHAPNPADSASI